MKTPSMRYSDSELKYLLQKLAFDHKVKPSQRIITGDETAPTHHTYVKRYGSVILANEVAGLADMTDSTHYRNLLADRLAEIDSFKMAVHVNNLVMDCSVETKDGKIFYLDVVHVNGVDDEIIYKHKQKRMWEMSRYEGYIQLGTIDDIITVTNKLKEEYEWL